MGRGQEQGDGKEDAGARPFPLLINPDLPALPTWEDEEQVRKESKISSRGSRGLFFQISRAVNDGMQEPLLWNGRTRAQEYA